MCVSCVEYYILRDTYEKESERWKAERFRVCALYYGLCMYIVCVCVVGCVTYVFTSERHEVALLTHSFASFFKKIEGSVSLPSMSYNWPERVRKHK